MMKSPVLGGVMPDVRACHGISIQKRAGIGRVNAKEPRMKNLILSLCLATVMGASPVLALEPLNTNARINDALIAGRVGDLIRKTCPSITARMFTVLQELNALEDYAREAGYSEAEVKAYLKDTAEKARIKALANQYLADAGAVEGDEETFCVVGRNEIANGTLAGKLLRSWK